MLTRCQGCAALFPLFDGPTHRYLGASAAIPARTDAGLDVVFGDAYGVQHHGEASPQAIQSVAVHSLFRRRARSTWCPCTRRGRPTGACRRD